MIHQKTLDHSISAQGIGLHTGNEVTMTLRPAPENAGVIFRRVDINPCVEIKVDPLNVKESELSTSLHNQNVLVITVEHLLAAISGLGIDNIYIDLTAPEVPIMDGSSSDYVFLLKSAGIKKQNAKKGYIKIQERIKIYGNNGDKVEFLPYNGFKITFAIDFLHPSFEKSNKELTVDFSKDCFIRDISRARTFGFINQYECLKARNLARGANMENTIVLGDNNILNEDGLRYNDEFIKHKVLDAVGDLYLLGKPIKGHFIGIKSGHALNHKLLKSLVTANLYKEVILE